MTFPVEHDPAPYWLNRSPATPSPFRFFFLRSLVTRVAISFQRNPLSNTRFHRGLPRFETLQASRSMRRPRPLSPLRVINDFPSETSGSKYRASSER
jgi:hypothetical protein